MPRNRQSAFTLVELLVVVAIIAVLLSILLPGLQRARERTRTIACANRMRQFSITMLMYANDSAGHWPGLQYSLAPFQALIHDLDLTTPTFQLCPSRRTTRNRSFSVNAYLWYRGWRRVDDVEQPTQTLLIVEEDEISIDNEHFAVRNNLWWNVIANRHLHGANMTFCDGHLEYWKWRDPDTGVFIGYNIIEMNNPDLDRINRAQCPPYVP